MKLSTVTRFAYVTGLLCLGTAPFATADEATIALAQQAQQLKQQQANVLVTHSQTLRQQIALVCSNNMSPASIQQVKQAWQQTLNAWVPFQGETIGPVSQLDLSWSMQFWPDKKNITGRKLSALLTDPEQANQGAITAADIQQLSVAVRGLGALELLVFETGLSAKSCPLSQAIADNVEHNAKRLQAAWQQPHLNDSAPTPTNIALSAADIAWVSELSHQLSFANKKFFMPLGNGEHVKPYQAESWRSETSMAQLKTSYTSLQHLYQSGIHQLLLSQGETKLAQDITQTFATLLADWPTQSSMVQLLKSDTGLAKLYRMRIDIEKLSYLIQDVMPVNLKIVIGFNATDGD